MSITATARKIFRATRPPSLLMTVAPVVIGTAMAFGDGIAHLPTALVALIGGLLIHAGTNLTNDYNDLKRGADRIGDFDPMRGMAIGQISPRALKFAAIAAFILALPPVFYLVHRVGWPITALAAASILAGILYTAGPVPLAYVGGFGDLFVVLFLGIAPVAGTYYVQSFEMNAAVALAGLAPGFFTLCVLTINNIRDYANDKVIGKRTLVARLGKNFGYCEFIFAYLSAFLVPLLIYVLIRDHVQILWAVPAAFLGIPVITKVLTAAETQTYNAAMGMTVNLLIIYTLIFSIAWILP